MTERGTAMRIPDPALPTHIAPHTHRNCTPRLRSVLSGPSLTRTDMSNYIYIQFRFGCTIAASFATVRDYPEMKALKWVISPYHLEWIIYPRGQKHLPMQKAKKKQGEAERPVR